MGYRKAISIVGIFCLVPAIHSPAFGATASSADRPETHYRPMLVKYQDPKSGESYVVALIDYDEPWDAYPPDWPSPPKPHTSYQKLAEHILSQAKDWLTAGYKQDYKKDFPKLDPKFFDDLGTPLDGRSRMVVVYQDESLTKILGTMRIAYSTGDHPELPMSTPDHKTSVPDSRDFMGGYPYLNGPGDGISWELASYGGPVGVEFKNFRKAPDAPDAVVPLMFYAAEKYRLTNAIVSTPGKGASRPLWYQLEALDPLTGYYKSQGWKENGTAVSKLGPTLHYFLADRLQFLKILIGDADGKKGMLQRPGGAFIKAANEKIILFDDRYLNEEEKNPLLDCLKASLKLL